MIVVMVKVIPTVSGIFDELGGDMPPSTKALISVSAFFQKHILWILLGLLLLTCLLYTSLQSDQVDLLPVQLIVQLMPRAGIQLQAEVLYPRRFQPAVYLPHALSSVPHRILSLIHI